MSLNPHNKTNCEIKILQTSTNGQAVLCDIYVNGALLFKGLQNINYPIPFGVYKATLYKGGNQHTRLLLCGVPGHAWVEIHEGNKFVDFKGCTGIGYRLVGQVLHDSVRALNALVNHVVAFDTCTVELASAISPDKNNA